VKEDKEPSGWQASGSDGGIHWVKSWCNGWNVCTVEPCGRRSVSREASVAVLGIE